MIDKSIIAQINDIIRSEVGIDPMMIDLNQSIQEQVTLDSMQFIGLVAKLELELDIELPLSIMQVNTLTEFYDAVHDAMMDRVKD